MVNVCAWNVRGLNGSLKHKAVHSLVFQQNISLCGLLETRLKKLEHMMAFQQVFPNWSFTTNFSCHSGGRMMIMWLSSEYDVTICYTSAQLIHLYVVCKANSFKFDISFVYGFNKRKEREVLWAELKTLGTQINGPWMVLGDFNNVLNLHERVGSMVRMEEIIDFRDCVDVCGLIDLNWKGCDFTWNNKQQGESRVFSKIDRALVNEKWLLANYEAQALFLPEGMFDHSPCLISFMASLNFGAKSFKYMKMWKNFDGYKSLIETEWKEKGHGCTMYQVISRLKRIKQAFKKFNNSFCSDIEKRARAAELELKNIQQHMHGNVHDQSIYEQENVKRKEASVLQKAANEFLSQKAKVKWLQEGDSNSALFHASLAKRRAWNKVYSIIDTQGTVHKDAKGISNAFLEFYHNLLGKKRAYRENVQELIVKSGRILNNEEAQTLCRPVTASEVKAAIFSIEDDKAPGPDGFGSHFFKYNWDIVQNDVVTAVLEFFQKGKMVKEINCTTLTLIPKVANPERVSEFRPIACCNTLYKCISKIMCSRLTEAANLLVSSSQSGFLPDRNIIHNVLICQDLFHGFARKTGRPRAFIKIDLKKAYDSLDWDFVQEMLIAMSFPAQFVQWVMLCITTPMYSLNLNGGIFGFFKGERGLRQGDPLSPVLFVLCLEYLSRIMSLVANQNSFKFFPGCKELKLTHLGFADDLMIMCSGDLRSIQWVMRALETFSRSSGLEVNQSKTAIFFGNVKQGIKDQILAFTGFQEGSLPVKYLGIPLHSKKLAISDCEILVDKITAKIRGWGSKKLSFAARLTLINSVLSSMYSYWAMIFLLPQKVLRDIEKVCRTFLWSGSTDGSSIAAVSWEKVCKDKHGGGLGIRNILLWNKAAIAKLLWNIASKKDSLWLQWVSHFYMKGADWRTYECPRNTAWSWRAVCKVKHLFMDGYDGNKWKHSKDGIYTVKDGYRWLQGHTNRKHWQKWVWCSLNVPKHAFISWLFAHGRLKTRDRLLRMGIRVDATCPVCQVKNESIGHLFTQCEFAQRCMKLWKSWIGLSFQSDDFPLLMKKIMSAKRVSKCRKKITIMSLNALLYNLWAHRNQVCWESRVSLPSVVVNRVKFDTKYRVCSTKIANRDRDWIAAL